MGPAGKSTLAGAAFALTLMTASAPNSADGVGEAVEVPGPSGPLRGTLRVPAVASAAVLIVPGSGPTDRDGDNPLGVAAGTYRLLAEGLAARGIASLRFDKRGLFGSSTAVTDANAVTLADYASDLRLWARLLGERAGTSCVWLLGHSEGGLVALSTVRGREQDREGICGLILASTAGQPLGRILREQLAANPANALFLEQAFAAIASLEKGERVDVGPLHPALRSLFRPEVQGFLIDTFGQDPAELAAAWKGPMLIVQGGRDLQVSVADAMRLHEAGPGSTLLVLPGVNHVLKAVAPDDRAANIAAYADPRLPLADGLVEAITDYIATPRSLAR